MRTASGRFSLDSAVTLESLLNSEDVLKHSQPIEEVLSDFGRVELPEVLKQKMINGVKVELSPYIKEEGPFYRVYVGDLFLGTAKVTEKGLFVDKYLYDQHQKN
jgi:tRNA U55 pseudouridine synthase TruB